MLDGLRSTFYASSGRLGRDAFIEALLCAVYDDGGGGGGEHVARAPGVDSPSVATRQLDDATNTTVDRERENKTSVLRVRYI